MDRMKKYVNLHQYATRLGEDDLTADVGPEATAAVVVGRVIRTIGNTIEETAQRLHLSQDQAAVDKFLDGVSEIAIDAGSMIGILVTDVENFATLPGCDGAQLKEVSATFEDGDHVDLLVEVSEFLNSRKEEVQ